MLVQPLFEGSIDIIGDVHGEIQALDDLLAQLGYTAQGDHPEGRKLVFVGDLGDRGPDSPGVVRRVADLVDRRRAQCVLGNHDFNAILAHQGGPMKPELCWLFDEAPLFKHHGQTVPQKKIRGRPRDDLLAFFATLPIALERPDVRVVHACWDDASIEGIRGEFDAIGLYKRHRARVEENLMRRARHDEIEAKLVLQNENPVKRLTSGVEGRSETPILVGGRSRRERRLPWWRDYRGSMVVFGHYWRQPLPWDREESLFEGLGLEMLLSGPSMCIDYSVGKRFKERLQPGFAGRYTTHLAAFRLPERVLFFDSDLSPREVKAEEG